MGPSTEAKPLNTFVGCGVAFAIFVVFVGVASATSFSTGMVAVGVMLVAWIVVASQLSAQRAAAHKAEREAVRAREVAEHQAYMAAKEAELAARRVSLYARFGDEVAPAIIAGRYWQGATMEMMRESLGAPSDVREQVYKTKTKTTLCYHPINSRQYGLKVHFENGIVVGWDD